MFMSQILNVQKEHNKLYEEYKTGCKYRSNMMF